MGPLRTANTRFGIVNSYLGGDKRKFGASLTDLVRESDPPMDLLESVLLEGHQAVAEAVCQAMPELAHFRQCRRPRVALWGGGGPLRRNPALPTPKCSVEKFRREA